MSQRMSAVRAHLPVVSNEQRGLDINRRRTALGIGSIKEFARATTRQGGRDVKGVSIDAITAAEKGEASDRTYARLEAWLDAFEEETGAVEVSPAVAGVPEPEAQMVTFHIGAIDVTVKGPVANLPELEAAVEKLLRGTKRDD